MHAWTILGSIEVLCSRHDCATGNLGEDFVVALWYPIKVATIRERERERDEAIANTCCLENNKQVGPVRDGFAISACSSTGTKFSEDPGFSGVTAKNEIPGRLIGSSGPCTYKFECCHTMKKAIK